MTKQDEWPTRLLTDNTQFTIAIHLIPFDGVMIMEKIVYGQITKIQIKFETVKWP